MTALSLAGESGGRDNRLVFQFARINPSSVDYQLEASHDMLKWTPVATLMAGSASWIGAGTVTESGGGATRMVKLTDSEMITSPKNRFLRLRVSVSSASPE